MRIKHLFFVWLFASIFVLRAQNFANAEIYEVRRAGNPQAPFDLLKVVHDSAYIYLAPDKIKLIHLTTGAILLETKVPKYAINFFVGDKGIDIISVEKEQDRLTISKQLLTSDLRLLEKEKTLTMVLERTDGYPTFKFIEKKNYYEFTYVIGCEIEDVDNYFQLITLDKKMNVIDNFNLNGNKELLMHLLRPESDYSNNIAYQLRISYKDAAHFTQLFLSPDSLGKIRKFKTNKLNDHINFTMAHDSAGRSYGYCLKVTSPEKNKFIATCDKFEMDHFTSSINIVKQDLFVKHFEFQRLYSVVMKTIVEPGRVRFLIYPTSGVNLSNSWRPINSVISQVTYYDLKFDEVTSTFHFPYKMALGISPFVGSSIFMGTLGADTYIGYSDDPDSHAPASENGFKDLDLVFADKLNYSPDFYKIGIGGHTSRSSLYDAKRDEHYRGFLLPQVKFVSRTGDLYLTFWAKSPGSMCIVKFSAPIGE